MLASGIRMDLQLYSKNKFEELVHLFGFIIREEVCVSPDFSA